MTQNSKRAFMVGKAGSYYARWGHERTRTIKGHPLREARRQRSYARGGDRPRFAKAA